MNHFIFFTGGELLHALAETPPRALQSVHVIAQALEFVFRSERPRGFHHRPEHIVKRIEVAVEHETRCRIFGLIAEFCDHIGQRRLQVAFQGLHVPLCLPLGRAVGFPFVDSRLLQVGEHALRRLLQLRQDAIQFIHRSVSDWSGRSSRALCHSPSGSQGHQKNNK